MLEMIKNAKPEEINEIFQTALARYRELFPDWEISTVSVEKKGNRNEQLNEIIAFIERMKDV